MYLRWRRLSGAGLEVNWTQLLSIPDLLSHTCSQTWAPSQNTTAGGEWGQEWKFVFKIEESVICLVADANDQVKGGNG